MNLSSGAGVHVDAEQLRQWLNVIANADLVPEALPAVAHEMQQMVNELEGRFDGIPMRNVVNYLAGQR